MGSRFTENDDMSHILDIIMASAAYRNYNYTRTKKSYFTEWRAHNLAYTLYIIRSSSAHVYFNKDFNGEDPFTRIEGEIFKFLEFFY